MRRALVMAMLLSHVHAWPADAQRPEHTTANGRAATAPAEVLTPQQWRQVDEAVERALVWLAAQQQANGSFPSQDVAQPAVTSLAVMAFLAHGHVPGEGPYGRPLERAIEFVLDCQKPSGLIALRAPETRTIPRDGPDPIAITTTYNHAIAGLMLSEAYGNYRGRDSERMQLVIRAAIDATLTIQNWQRRPADDGGWGYLKPVFGIEADMSVVGWHLQFLRAAANAGFDVPKDAIDRAVAFVRRNFHPGYGTFIYRVGSPSRSRAMAGEGVLALSHAGLHNSDEARAAAQWILDRGFHEYNGSISTAYTQANQDRYHYSLFHCSQAMYQLGGRYWQEFFPPAVSTLVAHQSADGSWARERDFDNQYGNAYTTALVVISLGAPNELLSIYQR
ncbi:MAG: prenyltransferase/squalene oxidase repeat-containing protein [Planctomycetaceae bacterium]